MRSQSARGDVVIEASAAKDQYLLLAWREHATRECGEGIELLITVLKSIFSVYFMERHIAVTGCETSDEN